MKTYVNILLTVLSMLTSLIAAWIKKEQYVDKINELDRYTQKINKLCEELQFEINKPADAKKEYSEFTEEYFSQISEYLSTIPSISPKEWQKCVIGIGKNYPELLTMDDTAVEKLWPWYSITFNGVGKAYRERTNFGKIHKCMVIRCCIGFMDCGIWGLRNCIRKCSCRKNVPPRIIYRDRYVDDEIYTDDEIIMEP